MASPIKVLRYPKIPQETWDQIKLAMVGGGLSARDAGVQFKIHPRTIVRKSVQERWPLQRRLDAKNKNVSRRGATKTALEAVEFSWAEKGDSLRKQVFDLAQKGLQNARLKKVTSWKDAEIADKMARRAAGLKDNETNAVVNFALVGSGGMNPAEKTVYSEAE